MMIKKWTTHTHTNHNIGPQNPKGVVRQRLVLFFFDFFSEGERVGEY